MVKLCHLCPLFALLLLCQCETTRTVKSTRSSISFDDKKWGGQGNADTGAIDTKFAKRGYTLAEDGTIIADKPDLYRGKIPRGITKGFETKESRFSDKAAKTKSFRTPEYLKLQGYSGVSEFREGNATAREGNSTRSPYADASKGFANTSKSSSKWGIFGTKKYREGNAVYKTGPDRSAPAVTNAPRATGTPRKMGYQDNVAMSLDDVKKMLNPNAYAHGKGLSD